MCGRARLPTDYSEIRIQLKLRDFAPGPNWRPSWNIAPIQDMLLALGDVDGHAIWKRIGRAVAKLTRTEPVTGERFN